MIMIQDMVVIINKANVTYIISMRQWITSWNPDINQFSKDPDINNSVRNKMRNIPKWINMMYRFFITIYSAASLRA